MITKSKARAPGRLTRHLARTDTNESVVVGHSRDVTPELHAAMQELALLGATVRGKKSLFHVIGNPEQDQIMTEAHWETYWSLVEGEYNLTNQPFIEVRHLKKERDHRHRVYSLVRYDGRLLPVSMNYRRNELISRLTEVAAGHPLRPGRHHGWVKAVAIGSHGITALQMTSGSTVSARLHQDEQQQAERKKLGDPQGFKAQVYSMYLGAQGDWQRFAKALDNAKVTVAAGNKAIMIVDEASLFCLPLARLLREEAKRAEQPIKITSAMLKEVFKRAKPLDEEIEAVRSRQQATLARLPTTKPDLERGRSSIMGADLAQRMTASLAIQLEKERRRRARLEANKKMKLERRRPRFDERALEIADTAYAAVAAYLIRCLRDGKLSLRTCIALIAAIAGLNNVAPVLLAVAAAAAIRRRQVRIARDALRIDVDVVKAARAGFNFAAVPIEARPRYADLLRSSLFSVDGPNPESTVVELGRENAARFVAWWAHASDKQRQVIQRWGASAKQDQSRQSTQNADLKKRRRRRALRKPAERRDGMGR